MTMMTDGSPVHRLESRTGSLTLPGRFNNPFRYVPAPVTVLAANAVLGHIGGSEELMQAFSGGKMLGVLVVRDAGGDIGFLAGFSGLAGGKSRIPYFVPPILDLTDPHGHFKEEEAVISRIGVLIKEKESSPGLLAAKQAADKVRTDCTAKISQWKSLMAESKARRDAIRSSGADRDTLASMIKESQSEKSRLKRLTAECRDAVQEAMRGCRALEDEISSLKRLRQEKSETLQRWISENMTVCNALGERKSVWRIFSEQGLVPPGGTGECAAPKLLHYAYTHGLHPVAMGEFWYGEASGRRSDASGEVRQHGRFYPSCTGKCGPLLQFMLQGLDVEKTTAPRHGAPAIIYEDNDIIVADKPSGMLSVPGKTGEESLQEILSAKTGGQILGVHRLDMDTSGLIVYARTAEAQKNLQRQFEKGEVRKEYTALLDTGRQEDSGTDGRISLPIAPDYFDRPRQKVDSGQGKEAVTDYRILEKGDGWAKVLFMPHTGRTHQLRVHAAHHMGLGSPIKGDILYGSPGSAERLCLHASYIQIRHPSTGCLMEFRSDPGF